MTFRESMFFSVALLLVFSMMAHWPVKAFAPAMRTPTTTSTSSSSTSRLFYMNEGDLSDADLIRQAQEARQKQQQQQQLQDKEVEKENIKDLIEKWEEQTFHRAKVRSCRAYLEGVSIAPDGFWTMLRLGQSRISGTSSTTGNDLLDDMDDSSTAKNGDDKSDMFIPLHVTMDPADAHATTSPEALTIIQLLSGVDMAGAILPPEVLSKVFVLECERMIQEQVSSSSQVQGADEEEEDDEEDEGDEDVPDVQVKEDPMILAHRILLNVQSSLPDPTMSFSETADWAQTRAKLPQVTMDELQIIVSADKPVKFQWKCQIENLGSLTIEPTNDMLGDVLYSYHPDTSLTFASLALAMRYKAPVTVVLEENPKRDEQEELAATMGDGTSIGSIMSLASLVEKFPMYETRQNLQTKSHRVQENIVRGFEIHKLTGALNIALRLGDTVAAAKIRKVLDDYDSLDALPTIPMAEDREGTDSDEDDDEDLDVLQ